MGKLTEIVKGTTSVFSHAIAGVLYYVVEANGTKYQFPIDMNDKNDVGTATFLNEEKTIFFMRYIRKAMDNNEFIEIR
jgi:hypothetical protein